MATAAPTIDSVLPPGYVRRDEALSAIGVSEATLERMTRDARIGSKLMPRAGKKSERVYALEDVERLKREKLARGVRVEADAALGAGERTGAGLPAAGEGKLVRAGALNVGGLRELLDEWLDRREAIGVRDKLWLTVDEAAELSGLSRDFITAAVRDGRIKALQTGVGSNRIHWRIRRADLEDFAG